MTVLCSKRKTSSMCSWLDHCAVDVSVRKDCVSLPIALGQERSYYHSMIENGFVHAIHEPLFACRLISRVFVCVEHRFHNHRSWTECIRNWYPSVHIGRKTIRIDHRYLPRSHRSRPGHRHHRQMKMKNFRLLYHRCIHAHLDDRNLHHWESAPLHSDHVHYHYVFVMRDDRRLARSQATITGKEWKSNLALCFMANLLFFVRAIDGYF